MIRVLYILMLVGHLNEYNYLTFFFRTRGRERPDNEHWTEISNPGTVVPVKRLKGGNILVKARVVRVSTAIQVTKKAIREAVAQHRRSRRRMAENGGIQRREMVEQGNPSVERGSNEGSRYLGVIDTTQVINKKFGKAAQGLWKMMGNAAQMARNHLDMEVWQKFGSDMVSPVLGL